ncbi:MAG: DUF192 domain-containing protein [Gammaproteobacteria bacterium]|nr:DUF192 domain-containing protein [Gammaproteobacteria bacterium]
MIRQLTTHARHSGIAELLIYCSLLLLPGYCSLLQACPVENSTISISVNGHKLVTEVATNLDGHMCGLAFRHELPASHGMLFAYAQDQIIGFWMKDTYIPLSIAFIDSGGRILEIHDMAPLDTINRYISKSYARYALEVNQGWFQHNGAKIGDRIEIDLQSNPEIFKYSAQ